MTWICPKCGVTQDSHGVRTVEVIEPGSGPRVEFYGRIRPEGSSAGPVAYSCLVCGHVWSDPDPEDPTPGGSSAAFPYPINESSSCCVSGCLMCNRDAC